MKRIFKEISSFFSRIWRSIRGFFTRGRGGKASRRVKKTARKHPIIAFVAALLILLLVIVAGNVLTSLSKEEADAVVTVREVQAFSTSDSPSVRLQARVDDSGVVEVVALSGGVVNSIPVHEGQEIGRGTVVVNLSSNYNGASIPGLGAQVAKTQYKNVTDTYDNQKDIIGKQREIANKSDESAEEMRKINQSSLNDTRSLLTQNQNLMTTLNAQLEALEASGGDPAAIFQIQQAQAQLQGGINQMQSTVRTLEYQTNTDNAPDELSTLQRDMTLRQLDVQERTLEMNRDVSKLQYQIAAVTASLLHPTSPFAGTVEKIHVRVGQNVAPGTVLATILAEEEDVTLALSVPKAFALSVSQLEPALFTSGKNTYSLPPVHISGVATDGTLFMIRYEVPAEALGSVRGTEYVALEVPIAYGEHQTRGTFVPIDAVYVAQDGSYVNVVRDGVVHAQEIVVGSVFGEYVEVLSGLPGNTQIILDRNVVSGERVTVK